MEISARGRRSWRPKSSVLTGWDLGKMKKRCAKTHNNKRERVLRLQVHEGGAQGDARGSDANESKEEDPKMVPEAEEDPKASP